MGKMMIRKYLPAVLLLGLMLQACDDGDIPEKEYVRQETGRVAKLTGRISGLDDWSSHYSVVLAAYGPESDYSLIQKALPVSHKDDSTLEMVLGGISAEASTVELAVSNSLRQRVMSIRSVDVEDVSDSDTIRIDLDGVDLSMMGVLQTGVLDKACIQCHGGAGFAAAGLNLTSGHSYDALVGTASSKVEGLQRVAPGDPQGSLLYQLITEGGENILHVNHVEIFTSQFKDGLADLRTMIERWIKFVSE